MVPPIEGPPSSASFLGELSASAARLSGQEDPARELMRLADDPLLLHMFLVRGSDIRLPMLSQQRRELLLPADEASRGPLRRASHLFSYRMASLPDPPSLRPEPYCPSEGECLAAPQETPVRCGLAGVTWFITIATGLFVAAFLVMLI